MDKQIEYIVLNEDGLVVSIVSDTSTGCIPIEKVNVNNIFTISSCSSKEFREYIDSLRRFQLDDKFKLFEGIDPDKCSFLPVSINRDTNEILIG